MATNTNVIDHGAKRKICEVTEPDEQTSCSKRRKIEISDDILNKWYCAICRNDSCFCPWVFPCGEHMACYACMVQYVDSLIECFFHYDDAKSGMKIQFENVGLVKCPTCKKEATACNDPKTRKFAFGHIWTSQIKPVETSTIMLIDAVFGEKKSYNCPNEDCKFTGSHLQVARHIIEGIRNSIKPKDGFSSENLLDPSHFASKKFKTVAVRESTEAIDWCTYIHSYCVWCMQKHFVLEDGAFLHLHETCQKVPCVCTQTCNFEGSLMQVQEHAKIHKKLNYSLDEFIKIFRELKDMDLKHIEDKHATVLENSMTVIVGSFLKHQVSKFGQSPSKCLSSPILVKLLQTYIEQEKSNLSSSTESSMVFGSSSS